MPVIEGAIDTYQVAGAPVAGTDEVQTLTITGGPTGGTFRLRHEGFTTATIAWNATAAAVDTALEALPSIGTGGVVAGGGQLPTTGVTVTFSGAAHAKKAVPLITVTDNLLTGGTTPAPAVAETTAGVDATHRGAGLGALLVDTTNKILYINTGSALGAPTWTKVGTQT